MTAPEPTPTAEHIDAVALILADLDHYRRGNTLPVGTLGAVYRERAVRVLNPTDPAVLAAMLGALVRAGVLTEFRIDALLNEDGSLTTDAYIEHCNVVARQFVTPWEVSP